MPCALKWVYCHRNIPFWHFQGILFAYKKWDFLGQKVIKVFFSEKIFEILKIFGNKNAIKNMTPPVCHFFLAGLLVCLSFFGISLSLFQIFDLSTLEVITPKLTGGSLEAVMALRSNGTWSRQK